MVTISATDARNNIGKLWETASREAVTVASAGKPIAVVISPEEYAKLTGQQSRIVAGFAKDLLKDVDVAALLAVPIDSAFSDYEP